MNYWKNVQYRDVVIKEREREIRWLYNILRIEGIENKFKFIRNPQIEKLSSMTEHLCVQIGEREKIIFQRNQEISFLREIFEENDLSSFYIREWWDEKY